jgi:uncharacterized protein YndB with AHSA1/START domain
MATVKTKDEPIVIEHSFSADPATIWEAITDTKKMKHWYFDMKDFRPDVGYEFRFLAGDDRQQYLHICKVTEVIPERSCPTVGDMNMTQALAMLRSKFFLKGRIQGYD